MRFKDMVAQAFESWDARMAIQISRLCESCGLNAEGTWEYVQKHRPEAERAEWDHRVCGKVQKVMDLRGPEGRSFAPWVALIFDLDGKLIDMEVGI